MTPGVRIVVASAEHPGLEAERRVWGGACDLAETCTGLSVSCPSDLYLPNGTTCSSGSGACQGGKCLLVPDAGVPDSGPDGLVDGGPDGQPASDAMADAAVSDADLGAEGDAAADASVVDADLGAGRDAVADTVTPDTTPAPDTAGDGSSSDLSIPADGDDGGCNCRMGPSERPSGLFLLLGALALFRRRRLCRY